MVIAVYKFFDQCAILNEQIYAPTRFIDLCKFAAEEGNEKTNCGLSQCANVVTAQFISGGLSQITFLDSIHLVTRLYSRSQQDVIKLTLTRPHVVSTYSHPPS